MHCFSSGAQTNSSRSRHPKGKSFSKSHFMDWHLSIAEPLWSTEGLSFDKRLSLHLWLCKHPGTQGLSFSMSWCLLQGDWQSQELKMCCQGEQQAVPRHSSDQSCTCSTFPSSRRHQNILSSCLSILAVPQQVGTWHIHHSSARPCLSFCQDGHRAQLSPPAHRLDPQLFSIHQLPAQ